MTRNLLLALRLSGRPYLSYSWPPYTCIGIRLVWTSLLLKPPGAEPSSSSSQCSEQYTSISRGTSSLHPMNHRKPLWAEIPSSYETSIAAFRCPEPETHFYCIDLPTRPPGVDILALETSSVGSRYVPSGNTCKGRYWQERGKRSLEQSDF